MWGVALSVSPWLSARVANPGLPNTYNLYIRGAECVDRKAAGMSGRTTARGLDILRDDLSGRDLAIIGQVADLRLMSARQIEAVHFPTAEQRSALSAARLSRRTLERLTVERLLVRLDRRVGGVRAGSSSYIYALGPVGHRLLTLGTPRPRSYREPTRLFTEHTLAIGDLVVSLTVAARGGSCQLVSCQSEPRCWRDFSNLSGRTTLKPDLFVALGIGDFEDRFFIEIDRGTEHLPTVIRKCRLYDNYYRSGREQADHGVFPLICVVAPDDERAKQLRRAIRSDRHLEPKLFVVTTTAAAPVTLLGGST
jgi:hypothetical protein